MKKPRARERERVWWLVVGEYDSWEEACRVAIACPTREWARNERRASFWANGDHATIVRVVEQAKRKGAKGKT